MSEFTSAFARKIDAMLDYRTTLGYKRETHLARLRSFDRFCEENFAEQSRLTREIVHAWLDGETISLSGLSGAATTIRQLGKYLDGVGEDAYVLPNKFTSKRKSFMPYIFTDDELSALFAALDDLPADKNEPFLNEIAPVLFRLIYTCGLRPGEGRKLLLENVNLESGEILITSTKYKKDRIVVMSDDMLLLCRKYDVRRNIFAAGRSCFFPASDGNILTAQKVRGVLNYAWNIATRCPGNLIPRRVRVYDLRHRFASACLNRWLDEGRDLMVMLPYLRAYMGHDELSETAYYIHILPENLMMSPSIDWGVFSKMLPEVAL